MKRTLSVICGVGLLALIAGVGTHPASALQTAFSITRLAVPVLDHDGNSWQWQGRDNQDHRSDRNNQQRERNQRNREREQYNRDRESRDRGNNRRDYDNNHRDRDDAHRDRDDRR